MAPSGPTPQPSSGAIVQASTDVGAVVHSFWQGPVGSPVLVQSEPDFSNQFGTPQILNSDYEEFNAGYFQVHQFFANGGTRLWVLRPAQTELLHAARAADLLAALPALHGLSPQVSQLIVPEAAYLSATEANAVHLAAAQFAVAADSLYLMEPPHVLTSPSEARTWADALPLGVSSTHVATYFPRIQISYLNTQVYVGASGSAAGLMAKNDADRGVWVAPAGLQIEGALALSAPVSDAEQSLLTSPPNGRAVNPVRAFAGPQAIELWGARSFNSNDTEESYLSLARTRAMLRKSVSSYLSGYTQDTNSAQTWTRVRTDLDGFLADLWRRGAFAGAKPETAYYENCSEGTTMTHLDVLNGKLKVEMGVALIHASEFGVLGFEQAVQPGN